MGSIYLRIHALYFLAVPPFLSKVQLNDAFRKNVLSIACYVEILKRNTLHFATHKINEIPQGENNDHRKYVIGHTPLRKVALAAVPGGELRENRR